MGGGGGQTQATQSRSTVKIPKEIRERGSTITTGAMDHYFDPAHKFEQFDINKYGGYGEQRTGQLNQGHQVAGQQFGDATGSYQPYINAATHSIAGSQNRNQAEGMYGPQYNSQNIQRYMNPFIQGVIDRGIGDIGDAMNKTRLDNQSRAAGAGAFGGARHGVIDAESQSTAADTMQRFVGDQLAGGFNQAVGQYNQDFQNQMAALDITNRAKQQNVNTDTALSQLYANLGQQLQGQQIAGGDANLKLAEIVRQQDQTERDKAYGAYLEERDYPMEIYERLAAVNAMQPHNRTTTTTGTTSTSGAGGGFPWGAAIGAAGSIISDVREKEDIKSVNPESILRKFAKVPSKSYEYKEEAKAKYPEMTGEGRRYGFMAQDLEKALPGTVKTLDDGVKTVDVGNTLGSLVAAVTALEKRTRKS
jgi:hypothetical protein